MGRTLHARSHAHGGFSLVELLLVVSLLMLFGTAAVVSLAPLWRTAPLEEGVGRLEGLLRFARAEAAQQGRRLRLHVALPANPVPTGVPESTAVEVRWEPEPLRQPGVFVQNRATAALAHGVNELVRVEAVRRLDPEGSAAPSEIPDDGGAPDGPMDVVAGGEPSVDAGDPWPPITFYPDGSSDSAEILLSVADAADPRRMWVRWDGLNGTASRVVAGPENTPLGEGGSGDVAQPLEPSSVARTAPFPREP